jgi:outer membrane protein
MIGYSNLISVLVVFMAVQPAGGVSDKVGEDSLFTPREKTLADRGLHQRPDTKSRVWLDPLDLLGDDSLVSSHQQTLADQGPQQRLDTEGRARLDPLDLLGDDSLVSSYQRTLADQGPQQRLDTEGRARSDPLDLLRPAPTSEKAPVGLEIVTDAKTGKRVVNLTIEQAIARALANSPEIRVVSFDPSIAREDLTRARSEFDVTTFGQAGYEKEDNPTDSIFRGGESDSRSSEVGIKQKLITGAEWSLAYGLTRNWDDLTTRVLPTRYEPMLSFQVRQPLLRDAWQQVTLAGIKISELNCRIALAMFSQKAQDVSTEVAFLYWTLLQARHDLEIQQQLVDKTLETLRKLEDRRGVDATTVQIKQAEAYVKTRQAVLFELEKRVVDVQDALVRLLSDHQLNLLSEFEIIPTTVPNMKATEFERSEALKLALMNNPEIQGARIGLAVAQINADVARRQKMPRLDLVGRLRTQGLSRNYGEGHRQLTGGEFPSWFVGVTLEYPLGNRQREAEFRKRQFEEQKAISVVQNLSDQVAVQVKERIRLAQTAYNQIQVQRDAVQAAAIHLQALEDTETIRETLTPEFLLVKLQGQEFLANAQRAETKAIADYNIALSRLARAMGTVLEMRYVRSAFGGRSVAR